MTAAQQEILAALVAECEANRGFGVTVRRLCELTGRSSPSTVYLHLSNLRRAGLVEGGRQGFRATGVTS